MCLFPVDVFTPVFPITQTLPFTVLYSVYKELPYTEIIIGA